MVNNQREMGSGWGSVWATTHVYVYALVQEAKERLLAIELRVPY